jgi:fructokinase
MLSQPFLVFGEVLWDIFPDKKRLGGAALNFAYYLLKAGGNPVLVSAVGRDDLGRKMVQAVHKLGLETRHIQIISKRTGTVGIKISDRGHAFYPSLGTANEYMEYPEDGDMVNQSRGLYLGTLSRYFPVNRKALDRLLDNFKGRCIFLDINLRKKFYTQEDILILLNRITHLKMNEREARLLRQMGLAEGRRMEATIEFMLEKYKMDYCCITLGAKGAVAGDKNRTFRVSGINAEPGGDSVGAGDAFSAFWLAGLLRGEDLCDATRKANRIGSIIASHSGAIVERMEME